MNADAWIARCAARLAREWPSLSTEKLHEVAVKLFNDDRVGNLLPEEAAEVWAKVVGRPAR